MDRNLIIETTPAGANYAYFNKCINGMVKYICYNITQKEADRGRAAIESRNPYYIENFIFSIM